MKINRLRRSAAAAAAVLTLSGAGLSAVPEPAMARSQCTGWTSGQYHYYHCNSAGQHRLYVWSGSYFHVYYWND